MSEAKNRGRKENIVRIIKEGQSKVTLSCNLREEDNEWWRKYGNTLGNLW